MLGRSYSATYTGTDEVALTAVVSVGIGYFDAAGNVGTAGSDSVSVNTVTPTVTVNLVESSLSDAANSSLVTFECSEPVTVFDASDVTLVGGTLTCRTIRTGDHSADGNNGDIQQQMPPSDGRSRIWQVLKMGLQPGHMSFDAIQHETPLCQRDRAKQFRPRGASYTTIIPAALAT